MSKNTRNRILLTAVAALLLVVMAVGGTLAWLQDSTTPVVNTFSTTNVDIQLSETTGTEYEMVPGATIAKDPKVTVIKNSEACWLFVKIDEANNTYTDANGNEVKLLTYDVDAEWTQVPGTTDVWYTTAARNDEENQEFQVIEQVLVSSGITNEVMDAHEGTNRPKLTFTAYAIQSDNLTVSAPADVWNLVKNATVYATPQNAAEGTLYIDTVPTSGT